MRSQLSSLLDKTITLSLLIIVGLTPLIFSSLTTEYYEMPKLAFLATAVLVLVFLWSLSWVINGKVLVTKTPLDLPLILLLIIVVVSTAFSSTKDISLLGSFPRVHSSAAAYVIYILFYFVIVSHLRSFAQIKTFFYIILASAVLLSVVSLLAFLGVYLPLSFAKFPNFTPAGSSFSLLSILILLTPLIILSVINSNRYLPKIPAAVLSILFLTTIILLGDIPLYLVTAIGVGLSIFISKAAQVKKSFRLLGVIAGALLITFALAFIQIPGNKNPIQKKMVNFQSTFKEIQLSFNPSWKVAISAFRDSPFLGTGPSTFLYDFTLYKPVEHNNSKYWNINFPYAYNEFLQTLATLGILGLLTLVLFSIIVINFSFRGLSANAGVDGHESTSEWDNIFSLSLALSGILAILLLLVHQTTLSSIVITLTFLAMFMATNKGARGKVSELSLGIKATSTSDSGVIIGDVLPIIIFIPVVVLIIFGLWNTAVVVKADYHHRQALNTASTPGKAINTYNSLVKAAQLNPRVDIYRLDLAQTNFALANSIAAQKGPTEASPGGSLTDQDKQTIQQLLSQSINEGRAAVTLNPLNAQNWEILASIYRQITGVAQNALQFSLDSYGRAIQRDSLNPALRLNVGGIYYSIKNYDLAIRFFSDAINLKPDYANAYFNLSVALRDKGDLQNAQSAAERVVSLLTPASPDYKTASEYLADLKARVATMSGSQSPQASNIIPPAAEENAALQNKNLPQLPVDLNEKENVATPAAVKKNPEAKIPSPSPSPSPTPTATP